MINFRKKLTILFIGIALCLPTVFVAHAQTTLTNDEMTTTEQIADSEIPEQTFAGTNRPEELFEAKITEIVAERIVEQPDGSKITQQDIKMKGLTGDWKNKEVEFNGISEIIAISGNTYRVGDHVIVNYQVDANGKDVFFITDIIRRWPIYILTFIFALAVAIIGKAKGLRSLFALIISFLIILKLTIPLILNGWNPLIVGIITCVAIFIMIIYTTDGLNLKSHLAVVSLTISLIIVAILSLIFTNMTRLTGMSGEETLFLIGVGKKAIDFQGLFLAGVLVGALGVLDDIVIGQIESVSQIKKANPNLPWTQVFKMAMDIGNAHIGAMVNTLFLAYAGASLPLLILFSINEPPFLTFGQVINNELIASEIVRTLVGSIGLVLAMPLSTYIAVKMLPVEKKYAEEKL